MTRVLPRTNLHSSKLIRCLTDLSILDAGEPTEAFGEKLGTWIHFADAIALSAVHTNSSANAHKVQSQTRIAPSAAVGSEFDRLQAALVHSITKSCSFNPGKTHIRLPAPPLESPIDPAAAYLPYRRFYESHQRDMELSIRPLRFNVREALARVAPELKTLAELDAALEKILGERESKLLAKVPVLLKKRFEQLYKEHQQKQTDRQQADNPAGWTQAGGWLAHFCNDMQILLLAELELRLQPTSGLIEAFKQDTQ